MDMNKYTGRGERKSARQTAILEVISHRLREHTLLEVAALAHQIVDRITV